MGITIVTDSSADISLDELKELGIVVVPLYVRFGEEVLRIGVDIDHDTYYKRLLSDPSHPTTIQPSPEDFGAVYRKLADSEGIVSIHISSKLSGTYNAAAQGKEQAVCPIEVIDSLTTTITLGLVCVAAARVAKAGGTMQQVLDETKAALSESTMLGLLDTLRYLYLGGRIGKAKTLLGSVLNVKPILTVKEGEVVPAGQVRTRSKGVEKLVEFVRNAIEIRDMAIGYNTTPDEAKVLSGRISPFYGNKPVKLVPIGPVLGVHSGPGTLIVAIRGKASI
jgi:DegV family protein with EDD domain